MIAFRTLALSASLLLGASAAVAAPAVIEVANHHAALVSLKSAARSVVIGDPKIADVSAEGTTQVVVFGKAPGSTTLTVFGEGRSVLLTAEILVRPAAAGGVTVTYGAGKDTRPGGRSVTYACGADCIRVEDERLKDGN